MVGTKRFERLDEDMICEKVGRDLTYHAQADGYPRVDCRDEEICQFLTWMIRPKKKNVIIIGESGVGKTSIVEEVAYLIASGNVPKELQDKRIIQTSFSDIWASVGKEDWGNYLDLLKKLMKECNRMGAFLFMDEIHQMFRHSYSMAYIKPAIARGELNILGATTEREYHTYIARDPAIVRRFQVLRLKEPNEDKTCEIVMKAMQSGLKDCGCTLNNPDTIRYLVQLTNSYIPYQFQPGKSLDIIDQIATDKLLRAVTSHATDGLIKKGTKKDNSTEHRLPSITEINKDDIKKTVCKSVGIPEEAIIAPREMLDAMQQVLNAHIMGQQEAISKLCHRLYISKAGVSVSPDRPDGVFLLAGPTGVGKTELAKALSTYLVGSDKHLIRLDMSTYNTASSIHSLIGMSGFYKDDEAQEVPLLTRLIKSNPYGVLLLDEIEKAHNEVRLLFLQAFDTGKMVDSLGNELYLKNLVIIMTTNTGFSDRKPVISTPGQTWMDEYCEFERASMEAISNKFPKEFLGRIDDILLFKPLTKEIMREFVGQKIHALEKITGKKFQVSNSAKEILCNQGFHSEFGARDLNRAIDNLIGYNLAKIRLDSGWDSVEEVIISVDDNKGLSVTPAYSKEMHHGFEFIAP
jgi:ATP-dependent Clp protease ATP-binding subunit ClpA